MWAVDSVADVSHLRQGLKSVQKPRRYVKMPELVIIQFETLLAA